MNQATPEPVRVDGKRYQPSQVYRSFRAAGFASQVNVVDLPVLRGGAGANRSLGDFLDLLGMKAEPPTGTVVAHLEHCRDNATAASDVVYAMLSERLAGNDAAPIDRLMGSAFIYDPELKDYLRADQVFWEPTYFRGCWHAPSQRMREREALFRHLGVQDGPTAANYVALLKEIARKPSITDLDEEVHRRSLAWLATALHNEGGDAIAKVRAVGEDPFLINRAGATVALRIQRRLSIR